MKEKRNPLYKYLFSGLEWFYCFGVIYKAICSFMRKCKGYSHLTHEWHIHISGNCTCLQNVGPPNPGPAACYEWRSGCACVALSINFYESSEYSWAHLISCVQKSYRSQRDHPLICSETGPGSGDSCSEDRCGSQRCDLQLSDIYVMSCEYVTTNKAKYAHIQCELAHKYIFIHYKRGHARKNIWVDTALK